jgi:hypothetical protein
MSAITCRGEFRAKCTLVEAADVKDVELDVDREGAFWHFCRAVGAITPASTNFPRR